MVRHQAPGVAFAEEGVQVVHAALSHGRLEAVVVRDDPCRQIPGVAATGDHLAIRIHVRKLGGDVGGGEDILRRTRPPILIIPRLEITSVSARSARIRIHDGIPARCEVLEFMPHRRFSRSPHGGWTSVDVQHQRVGFPILHERRFHGPVLHIDPIHRHNAFLRITESLFGDPMMVEVADAPHLAAIEPGEHHFERIGHFGEHQGDSGRRQVEIGYALFERREAGDALGAEFVPVQRHPAVGVGREIDEAVVAAPGGVGGAPVESVGDVDDGADAHVVKEQPRLPVALVLEISAGGQQIAAVGGELRGEQRESIHRHHMLELLFSQGIRIDGGGLDPVGMGGAI